MKYTLITGASKGLGYYLARYFFKKGYSLVLHGRDLKRLNKLKDEFAEIKTLLKQIIEK